MDSVELTDIHTWLQFDSRLSEAKGWRGSILSLFEQVIVLIAPSGPKISSITHKGEARDRQSFVLVMKGGIANECRYGIVRKSRLGNFYS